MTDLTQWARQRFALDRYATLATGCRIDQATLTSRDGRSEGSATCSLSLTEEHRNAAGAVMGGVFFTLADFATAVAINLVDYGEETMLQQVSPLHWVTVNGELHLLTQPRGDSLVASTRIIKQGRSTCLVEVSITDGDRRVAVALMSGYRIVTQ